jgi:hypothetical protein
MAKTFFLQNTPYGNAFATVSGVPTPGAEVICQPYNGGLAQQWIPAQYPGTDPGNTGGVVCALYTADGDGLVLTGDSCQARVTLQRFQELNLHQLWAYQSTGGPWGVWLNLATGCALDSAGASTVQTFENKENRQQLWTVVAYDQARAAAEAAVAPALAGTAG